jgi:beta-glucosidase
MLTETPAASCCAVLCCAVLCRFHWDLPQVLQDKYKGFMDPQIQEDFLYYADAIFANLGDLVDQWMTFNEVISICELGYERDTFAPGVSMWTWQ